MRKSFVLFVYFLQIPAQFNATFEEFLLSGYTENIS